ncbi:Ran GTPase binding protein Sbp1 [Parahypoxylon ruwenzoriense]
MTIQRTEPKVEETKPAEASEGKPLTSAPVFSMFGGGAKKEKKDEDEDRGDNSGSAKAQREAAAAAKGEDEEEALESEDVHFEPVHKLTEKVKTVTHEESEEEIFNMRCKMFRFTQDNDGKGEWKERGTGPLRLLKHKESGKIRLVMRRDKTLKVCANHYITPDMTIAPMSTSDRAWLWNVGADVSEGEPEAITVSVRVANAENAQSFKEAWLKAQKENAALFEQAQAEEAKGVETKVEETKAEEKKEEPVASS